jgi:hypothetical protein
MPGNSLIALLRGGSIPESFLLEPAISVTNIVDFVEWYKSKGGNP